MHTAVRNIQVSDTGYGILATDEGTSAAVDLYVALGGFTGLCGMQTVTLTLDSQGLRTPGKVLP